MSNVDLETKKKIRRSALLLLAVALTFYIGFILSGVLRA